MKIQVNNACSTGSTALFMAKQLVQGGMADCAMAIGFEKMAPGSLGSHVINFNLLLFKLKHFFKYYNTILNVQVKLVNFSTLHIGITSLK